MVLLPEALETMLETAIKVPDSFFFYNPLVYDYLTGEILPNGPHLYNTKLLTKAIKYIPKESASLRPETYTFKTMERKGHPFLYIDSPLAFHEFEQSYQDIFSRVQNKYLKNPRATLALKKRFNKLKISSKDFEVAAKALKYATSNKNLLGLDYQQFTEAFLELNIPEKESIKNTEAVYKKLTKKPVTGLNNYIYRGYSTAYYNKGMLKKNKGLLSKLLPKLL